VRTRFFLAVAFSILAVAASAQEPVAVPVPVIERISTQGDVITRTSLFSNGVVVVTIREAGVQVFMRQITLADDQYIVYLGVVESAAKELSEKPITSRVETSRARIELALYIGPKAPRRLEFSPMSTISLPLSRIVGVMDDLELLVRDASDSSNRLQTWEPKRGDRVQLMNGSYATVVEVWDEGLLILAHDDTFVRESVPPDMRDKIILLVVEPEP
jgi:hypothetical protein